MEFLYKAKNKAGRLIKGAIASPDSKAASVALSDQGLFVINISEKKVNSLGFEKLFQRKTNLKEKIIFTQQLAMMIRSGLSLVEALEALRDEMENKQFSKEIDEIISDIKGGTTLSLALSKHPQSFNEIYINMTKAGENSGKLDLVLERLAMQLEKDYELTRKIKGALYYPFFVLIVLVVVLALVITIIIPQLKNVFDDAGVDLPFLTRMLIELSNILKQYGLYIAALSTALVIALVRLTKQGSGRVLKDKLILKIPIIGNLLEKSYISRFTRTFSSLVSSGMPVINAMEVSSSVIGNVVYEKEISKLKEDIRNGKSVSSTLKSSLLFPKMVGQLSTVGEKSGNLDEVFDKTADFYDRDIESITANLSSLLEPVLMVIMGIGIGIIIISILQPIYGLVNAI